MSVPARVLLAERVVCRQIGDEAVLLDLASATYFGLDPVGAKFWTLLSKDADFAIAHAAMLQEYDVDGDVLRADLAKLCEQLAIAGLVSIE